jgi:hypothetical protein
VQDMALESLPVLGQEANLCGRLGDFDSEGVLGRANTGQAMAYGADPADPRRQDAGRSIVFAFQHHFKETRSLDDLPGRFNQLAILDFHPDIPVPFHPGQVVHIDLYSPAHFATPS